MNVPEPLDQRRNQAASNLAAALKQHACRVVFAESCTAGMLAASLAQIPGISDWLCGSMVTYRESAKTVWLGVAASTLASHTAESLETTREMAIAILDRTEEADLAAAVTGHLGPGVAAEIDGCLFVVMARRGKSEPVLANAAFCLQSRTRVDRQVEAAALVLEFLVGHLSDA